MNLIKLTMGTLHKIYIFYLNKVFMKEQVLQLSKICLHNLSFVVSHSAPKVHSSFGVRLQNKVHEQENLLL